VTTATRAAAYLFIVTETPHTQPIPPEPTRHLEPPDSTFEPYKPSSPEFRAAVEALRGMRQDLFHDAFAYRPLPRLSGDAPFVRRFSGRWREYATWTPHALITAAGLFAMLIASHSDYRGAGVNLFLSLLALGPVLLTMVRPIGAFWLSMAATPVAAVVGSDWGDEWPWLPGSFVCHLFVLTIVALRTRPRTAAWMWVLTGVYGTVVEIFPAGGSFGSNTMQLLFVSAICLLAVSLRHIRREARQEVTAQQTVTAHERSRRTLLEERTTIARELHDVVAHHMSVVAIQAEAAP